MSSMTCVIANTTTRSKNSSRGDALLALDRSIDHRYEVEGRGISLVVADRA